MIMLWEPTSDVSFLLELHSPVPSARDPARILRNERVRTEHSDVLVSHEDIAVFNQCGGAMQSASRNAKKLPAAREAPQLRIAEIHAPGFCRTVRFNSVENDRAIWTVRSVEPLSTRRPRRNPSGNRGVSGPAGRRR